jgi:hypothetical protein
VNPGNEKPPNENAPSLGPGARQNVSSLSNSQTSSSFKSDDDEERRNSALCFQNTDKTEMWHADFCGVLVAEDLSTGSKVWVNVREKVTQKGKPYLVVTLRPWRTKKA